MRVSERERKPMQINLQEKFNNKLAKQKKNVKRHRKSQQQCSKRAKCRKRNEMNVDDRVRKKKWNPNNNHQRQQRDLTKWIDRAKSEMESKIECAKRCGAKERMFKRLELAYFQACSSSPLASLFPHVCPEPLYRTHARQISVRFIFPSSSFYYYY